MLPRLHLVTEDAVLAKAGFVDDAVRIIARLGAGVAVHLRGHGTPGGQLFDIGRALASRAAAAGSAIFVNDRIDIALALAAELPGLRAGCQLGRRSIPVARARALVPAGWRIGYSAHSTDESVGAVAAGADFIVLGAIYSTTSHPAASPPGPRLVSEVAGAVACPVIAIGGIQPERVGEVAAAGAYGVAVLGGVWHGSDPAAAAARYAAALNAVY